MHLCPAFPIPPEKLSRWGHHYFCDDDGGRLIFDLNSPKEHRCVVCGKVYRDETQNGVWITFYRNRAVVMTLVSALIYKATGETKYRDYAVRVMESTQSIIRSSSCTTKKMSSAKVTTTWCGAAVR